ncbi:MAG: alanine--tRNA ligase-related protein [Patescibacteria group bacterium]
MATKLLYLEAFDIVSCEAQVVSVDKAEDGRDVVILDQTCFYPRGGGQDWDTGTVKAEGGSFSVEEVRLDEHGVVHHIGNLEGKLSVGQSVQCEVNKSTRQLNTKLHSAGHLVDMAMQDLQPEWIPARGAHYPHMSFVEYQVPQEAQVNEEFKAIVQARVSELSKSAYDNQLLFMSKDEMTKYCRHVPDNLPSNKPSRIVLYSDDFGIPCGGTHVKKAQDVGDITITKIKIKKGLAKVSYAVDGIN